MATVKSTSRATVRVLCTTVRLLCGRLIHGARLRFRQPTCLALSDSVDLSHEASIDFGRKLRTRGRCIFNVQGQGKLLLGENVFLNNGCQIHCRKRIDIGSGTMLGPNVLIYDHDHAYQERVQTSDYLVEEVIIGERCWIGAGSIILRGTRIGDKCVIAAGSVVKGDVPAETLLIQKRKSDAYSIKPS